MMSNNTQSSFQSASAPVTSIPTVPFTIRTTMTAKAAACATSPIAVVISVKPPCNTAIINNSITKVRLLHGSTQHRLSSLIKQLSLVTAGLVLTAPVYAANVFINEFHYDNLGSDLNEGIEIVGESGLSLDGWQLQLYNGGDGRVYRTQLLSGTFLDQSEGLGTLAFSITGIQNGPADAFALINNIGELTEFISYEGSVTASNGAANGQSSDDVGIVETTSSAIGDSMQRVGIGS